MIKRSILGLAVWSLAVSAGAQPMRTQLVKERQLPEAGGMEVGVTGTVEDAAEYRINGIPLGIADAFSVEPYARYGLTGNFSVHATIPVRQIDSAFMDSESGVGDIRLGADLLVYEDIFKAPWVIPYATVSLPTGDEDKGLGTGGAETQLGVAVGARMYDNLEFILDGRYEIIPDRENRRSVGGAVTWDVSKKFSLLGEFRTFEDTDYDPSMYRVLGGMAYQPTKCWTLAVYTGWDKNNDFDYGDDNTIGMVRASYSFP